MGKVEWRGVSVEAQERRGREGMGYFEEKGVVERITTRRGRREGKGGGNYVYKAKGGGVEVKEGERKGGEVGKEIKEGKG